MQSSCCFCGVFSASLRKGDIVSMYWSSGTPTVIGAFWITSTCRCITTRMSVVFCSRSSLGCGQGLPLVGYLQLLSWLSSEISAFLCDFIAPLLQAERVRRHAHYLWPLGSRSSWLSESLFLRCLDGWRSECFFTKSFSRRFSENPDLFSSELQVIFVRSSFDLSVNHLGVLLHGETMVLVLHSFHVEVDRRNGLEHFAKLQLMLPLLDICICYWMLLDWLAAALLSDVFLIVLRLVSVEVLGSLCLLVAVLFFCPLLALLFSVLFIIAPDLRCSSRSVLVPLLLYFILFTTGSLVFRFWCGSHHWLFGCGSVCASSSSESLRGSLRLRGSFLASPHTTTKHCATSWLMVRGRCPRSTGKLFTTTCSAVCEVWSEKFAAPSARRGLQYHCAILWAVSTLETKAFIAASCHGVVHWVVRHRWACFLYRLVSLTENLCLYCECQTLHPFTCFWCLSLSLACTRAAVPTLFDFCCAQSVMRLLRSADIRLFWSGVVPRCRRACLDSDMSGGAFLLSFTLVLEARLAPIPRLPIFAVWSSSRSLSPSLMLVCCRFEILQHRTCRLRRGRVSAGSGPCCVSSSASSVAILALVELRQFSAQPWSTPETLRHHIDKKFPGCPHSTWDVSCRTRDKNSASFRTEITRSLCNWASVSISKSWNTILLVTEMI